METSKEYYDKIISDYKSNGSGRSLRVSTQLLFCSYKN